MTPKFSLVTVVAVALVAIPAAWGGQAQSNPRATLASDSVEMAREQARAAQPFNLRHVLASDTVDMARAGASQPFNARDVLASDSVDAALATERSRRAAAHFYANATRVTLSPGLVDPVLTQSSGREIEWPQIGMGFGLGILLAVGLFLAMRYTRIRTLAH